MNVRVSTRIATLLACSALLAAPVQAQATKLILERCVENTRASGDLYFTIVNGSETAFMEATFRVYYLDADGVPLNRGELGFGQLRPGRLVRGESIFTRTNCRDIRTAEVEFRFAYDAGGSFVRDVTVFGPIEVISNVEGLSIQFRE